MRNVAIGMLLLSVLAPFGCASTETPKLTPTLDAGTAVAITIAPNPVGISVGQSAQLAAVVTNADGSLADVTSNPATLWTTNDPGIATVNLTGRVVGVTTGQTKINVLFGNQSTSVVVTVVQ
jgi:uncharacterized protein YjdB